MQGNPGRGRFTLTSVLSSRESGNQREEIVRGNRGRGGDKEELCETIKEKCDEIKPL